jgi:hypothetical protein
MNKVDLAISHTLLSISILHPICIFVMLTVMGMVAVEQGRPTVESV